MPVAEIHSYRAFEDVFDKPFDRVHNVLDLFDETHLDVYLGKLRLTVGSQVLVAEAFCYLIISVETRDHKKLLIKLRRLRQRVETTLVNSGRNEIISRALGRGPAEHRRFHFDETVLVKKSSRRFRDFVSQKQVLLERRSSQVEISVF